MGGRRGFDRVVDHVFTLFVVGRTGAKRKSMSEAIPVDGYTSTSFLHLVSKRVIDLTLSLVLLVVLAPLLAIIAIAIRLDSKGPALFVQPRIGALWNRRDNGAVWERTVFSVYKFRSMYTDTDDEAHKEYIRKFVNGESYDGSKDNFKITGDPRVTRVGHILRRTSLDELPQLFNVVKGDMSLVGPRPVPKYEVELYDNEHMERFCAVPGMTGYWQVYGRGSVPFDEMIEMDTTYVKKQSLRLDMWLLVMTVPAVFRGNGAK